jgi:hypothetical protein
VPGQRAESVPRSPACSGHAGRGSARAGSASRDLPPIPLRLRAPTAENAGKRIWPRCSGPTRSSRASSRSASRGAGRAGLGGSVSRRRRDRSQLARQRGLRLRQTPNPLRSALPRRLLIVSQRPQRALIRLQRGLATLPDTLKDTIAQRADALDGRIKTHPPGWADLSLATVGSPPPGLLHRNMSQPREVKSRAASTAHRAPGGVDGGARWPGQLCSLLGSACLRPRDRHRRRAPRPRDAGRAWPLLLADHDALLVARHGRGRVGKRLVDGGQLAGDRPELLLDRAQPALDTGVGVERGEAPIDAVDEVLDALKPLRDRADPAREALDVAGRGDVQRVNATSRARTAFSRASNARVSARVTSGFSRSSLANCPSASSLARRWRRSSAASSSSSTAEDASAAVTPLKGRVCGTSTYRPAVSPTGRLLRSRARAQRTNTTTMTMTTRTKAAMAIVRVLMVSPNRSGLPGDPTPFREPPHTPPDRKPFGANLSPGSE